VLYVLNDIAHIKRHVQETILKDDQSD